MENVGELHLAQHRARRLPGYAPMLYVGLVLGLWVGDSLARRAGLEPVRAVGAMALLFPVCLVGARALAVALNWSHFRAHPAEILRMDHGGAAMYGALPPVFLLSVPVLSWFDLPLGAFWDVAMLAILTGSIPTRLGCLSSGCCAGRRSHGLLSLPLRNMSGVRERRLPSPLFEAVLGGGLLWLALSLWERLPFSGAACLLVLGGYAAGRLVLEGLREDRGRVLAGLGIFQWISLAILVPCALGLAGGWVTASEPVALSVATTAPVGVAHLIVSSVLLLPVMALFRFLGCSLLLTEKDPEIPQRSVSLGAVVPDGGVSATIKIEQGTDMVQIDGSPFELTAVYDQPLADGRQGFATQLVLEDASYRATCTILRGADEEREEFCDGALASAGAVVLFEAPAGDATGELTRIDDLCFDPPTEQQVQLRAAVPPVPGTAATMVLEPLFGDQIDVVLEEAGTLPAPDDRMAFETLMDLPEGFYRVTCTVDQPGQLARTGTCGSRLNGPGKSLTFLAVDATPVGILNVAECFEDILP